MNRWITYCQERSFLTLTLLVVIGIALSGCLIGEGYFSAFAFIFASLGMVHLGFLLRLDNDLKDLERDRIAFPGRALARGLLAEKEVREMLFFLKGGLVCYFVATFFLFPWVCTFWLIPVAAVVWCLLQGTFSRRLPLVYEFLPQVGLFFVALFVVALNRGLRMPLQEGFGYALALFGAASLFEICRKLDPLSHPASLRPVHYFGFRFLWQLSFLFFFASALGAYFMGVSYYLWPCQMGVFVTLSLLFKAPRRYDIPHVASAISLVIHAWSGVF